MANRSAATADNKAARRGEGGGKRASSLCSGTRGDGRLCDALIILKQSLVGRPCIVQKSRGNSEKEEDEGEEWVGGRSVSVRLSAGKRHAEWCGGKEGEESSPLVDAAFISRLRNPRSSDSRSTNRPCPRHRGRGRGRDSTTPLEIHRNRRKRPVDTPLPVQSRLLLLPQDTTILLADHFLRAAFNPCFRRWITRSFVTR